MSKAALSSLKDATRDQEHKDRTHVFFFAMPRPILENMFEDGPNRCECFAPQPFGSKTLRRGTGTARLADVALLLFEAIFLIPQSVCRLKPLR